MATNNFPYIRTVIRALRNRHGYTQEQLAEIAGCDYKHLQLLEGGKRFTPTLTSLEKIARALKTRPWVILCDDLEVIRSETGLTSEQLKAAAKTQVGRPKGSSKNEH